MPAASLGFTLISDLLKDISQKVRACPKISQQRAYCRAVRDFCRQTQWYGVNVTAVLDIGTTVYDVNALGQLEVLNVDSVSLQPLPATNGVVPVPLNVANPNTVTPDIDNGRPVWYGYLPEGAIAFNPPPDKAYPVTVRLIVQPIIEATEIPTELTVKWQTAFEAGALAYLFSLVGEPWADKNEQVRYQREFQARINDGKADKQRGYVVGSVRARPKAFVTRGFGYRSI